MKLKLVIVAILLSFTSLSQSAEMQTINNYGQSTTDCNCQPERGFKLFRCMYGTMVSNGNGVNFRLYGFPQTPCCGTQPKYPVYGMGGGCQNGCPKNWNHR